MHLATSRWPVQKGKNHWKQAEKHNNPIKYIYGEIINKKNYMKIWEQISVLTE